MSKLAIILLTTSILFVSNISPTKDTAINGQTKQPKEETVIVEESNQTASSEEDIVSFASSIEVEVENIVEQEQIKDTDYNLLKQHFITITDFILYDGTINGKTFNDLTDSAKIQILNIYTSLDEKIESVCPHYKEDIKQTSTNIYQNITEEINNIKVTLEEKYKEKVGIDSYNTTKELYEEDKERLKEAYNTTKDKVKEKTKELKDNFTKWYNNYKNGVE